MREMTLRDYLAANGISFQDILSLPYEERAEFIRMANLEMKLSGITTIDPAEKRVSYPLTELVNTLSSVEITP